MIEHLFRWPTAFRVLLTRRKVSAIPLVLLVILSAPGVSVAGEGKSDEGKSLYESNCIACHAAGGAGDWFKAVPSLAGQRSEYLQQQLDAFAKGTRKSSSMHWVLKRRPLNHSAERAALVSYLSGLPMQEFVSGAVRGDEALGQRVYEDGCAACHGADESGSASQPIISHQQYSYLVDRLRYIRQSDPTEIAPAMRAAVLPLSEAQIAAVANFLSRTPAAPPR